MKLFRTAQGWFLEHGEGYSPLSIQSLDDLLAAEDFDTALRASVGPESVSSLPLPPLAPVGSQEVWASGVTYFRSRSARMEESKEAGGGSFYDRVYLAERPELFYKSQGSRVIGPGGEVRIRRDATWSVPEPELTLVLHASGQIVGYTLGNDMSSRDIEGENPLYLPQAKVYDGSCALGPAILLAAEPLPRDTRISIVITRNASPVFEGETRLMEMKRDLNELARYLFLEYSFPTGAFLLTGTGVVPPDSFNLKTGDRMRISIEVIGTLENVVG